MNRPVTQVSAAALCAALYAVSNIAFAAIPTPWGVGQFRPGVIVPAIFAVLFGPWTGAIGASLGTLLSSIFLPSGLGPVGSLVSGVPGNFAGFYILGWLVRRRRDWTGYLEGSLAGLAVGNLVAAGGVMFWLTSVVPRWASWAVETQIGVILGFTLFWFATMLPFVLLVVPLLLKALNPLSKRMELGELGGAPNSIKTSLFTAFGIFVVFSVLLADNDGIASSIFYAVAPVYRNAVIALVGLCIVFILLYEVEVRKMFRGSSQATASQGRAPVQVERTGA